MVEFKRYCSERAKKDASGDVWTVPLELTEEPSAAWFSHFVDYLGENKLPYGIEIVHNKRAKELAFKGSNKVAVESKTAIVEAIAAASNSFDSAS